MSENNQFPNNLDIIKVLKDSKLTPSQKVSVITEINNKNQPAKNLSHVPCKFFKQGTCQAGDSCPFSHDLNINSETQHCKYFQKGNCKFGVKCALAHITPEGKMLNSKQSSQPKYSPIQTNSQFFGNYTTNSSTKSINPIWNNAQSPSIMRHSFSSPSQLVFSADTNTDTIDSDTALDTDDAEDIDFIPSSLADLLTPQERSRRASRSSFSASFARIKETLPNTSNAF